MKVLVKEYMLDMLDSVLIAIEQLPKVDCEKNEHLELLGACQDVVIKIAEVLPEDNSITDKILVDIDNSCKEMYQLTQLEFLSEDWKKEYELLNEIIESIINRVKEYEIEKMTVLFMPVLIENWGSMESIYKAAIEDERINAKVMPIPYAEYGYGGTIADNKWDFEFFKKNISGDDLLDCNAYDFEKEHPEIVFINDPYDGEGDRIRIQPRFFADEIVSKTDHIIYVSPEFKETERNIAALPGIKNAWKIIASDDVEKTHMIQNGIDEEKVLNLKSARNDIIFSPKDAEVTAVVELKKTLEKDNEFSLQMIDKILKSQNKSENIKYNWFRDKEFDVNIKRDEKDIIDRYENLMSDISDSDKNQLIERIIYQVTLEKADMYIGQGNSWISNLFAEKRIPVLKRKNDEVLREKQNLSEKPLIGFSNNFVQKGKDIYCYSKMFNGVLHLNLKDATVTVDKGDNSFNKAEECLYGEGCVFGNKLIFAPGKAGKVFEKDLITGTYKTYGEKGSFEEDDYDILGVNTFTVLMPQKYNAPIYYINRKNGEINEFKNHYEQVIKDIEYIGDNKLFVAKTEDGGVLYRSIITNSLIQSYDAQNAEFRYGTIGENKGQIWDLKYDGKFLWCINNEGTKVSLWNRSKNVISKTINIMDDSCGAIKPCDHMYISENHRWFLAADRKTVVHMDKKGQKRVVINVDEPLLFEDQVMGFAYGDEIYFLVDSANMIKIKYINKSGCEELKYENIEIAWNDESYNNFIESDTVFNMNMIGIEEFLSYTQIMKTKRKTEKLVLNKVNNGEKIWKSISKEIFENN